MDLQKLTNNKTSTFKAIDRILNNNKKKIFEKLCFQGDLEGCKLIYENYGITFGTDINDDFIFSDLFCSLCETHSDRRRFKEQRTSSEEEMLEVLKWLYKKFKKTNNSGYYRSPLVRGFRKACRSGDIKIVQWLWGYISEMKDLIKPDVGYIPIEDRDNDFLLGDDEYDLERYINDNGNLLIRSFKSAFKHGKKYVVDWLYKLCIELNRPIDIHDKIEYFHDRKCDLLELACYYADYPSVYLAEWVYKTSIDIGKPFDIHNNNHSLFKMVCKGKYPIYAPIAKWLVSIDKKGIYSVEIVDNPKDGQIGSIMNWSIKE